MPKRLLVRLCALAATVTIFTAAWLMIGTRPWQVEGKTLRDPRLLALERRENVLQREADDVRRQVRERWASYRRRLEHRRRAIAVAERRHRRELRRAKLAAQTAARAPQVVAASAPSVSLVSLPPVTQTSTS